MGKKLLIGFAGVLVLVLGYMGYSSLQRPDIIDPGANPDVPQQVGEPIPGPNEDIQGQVDPEKAITDAGNAGTEGDPNPTTESEGSPNAEPQPLVIPAAVVTALNQCFPSGMQSAVADLGQPNENRERWLDYSLKMPDGKERRVHVENFEEDSGKVRSTLVIYDIDAAGEPAPVSIDARDQENPTADVVQNYLNQGQLKTKERSILAMYPGGLKMETVEKQGRVNEIEFEKDGQFFRCDQVDKVGTCFCSK